MLRAGEQDDGGLIDGVVAAEPVDRDADRPPATASSSAAPRSAGYGKTLADYTTYGNVYQPCAALAAGAAMTEISVFNYLVLTAQTGKAAARCAGLAAKGLVSGADTAAQSLDALNKLRAYGWTTINDRCTTRTTRWATGRSCRRCTR